MIIADRWRFRGAALLLALASAGCRAPWYVPRVQASAAFTERAEAIRQAAGSVDEVRRRCALRTQYARSPAAAPVARTVFRADEPGLRPAQEAFAGLPFWYPPGYESERGGIGKFACVVSEFGNVQQCRALEAPPGLEEHVIRSLQTRLFEPAILRGVFVATEVQFEASFPAAVSRSPASDRPGAVPVSTLPPGAQPDGLKRPERVSGTDPVYTAEAHAAEVEGTALVACTIEPDGSVTGCNLVDGPQCADAMLLRTIGSWRYAPVLFRGRPVTVRYGFRVRMAP